MPASPDTPTPIGALADAPALPESPAEPIRISVIDRETAFTRVFARRAQALGWTLRVFVTTPPMEELSASRPGAVLVDAGACPDLWRFISTAIATLPETGLLVLSQRSTVSDRVRALRLGADDWIAKPAHPEEVMARVQAVMRRRRIVALEGGPGPVVAGELEVRPDRFQAYVAGRSVGLTRREYELLQLLAGADGRVLEREEIYQRIWGYAMVRGDRSVDVFVGKIRGKLAAASPGWSYVHTHFGIGYRFEAEPADEA